MVGPRDRRPPYRGHWYPHSTNGWGIFDFLEPVRGGRLPRRSPTSTSTRRRRTWPTSSSTPTARPTASGAARRAADGHPAPYGLRHLQLGNEEKVDDAYCAEVREAGRGDLGEGPDDHPRRRRLPVRAADHRPGEGRAGRRRGVDHARRRTARSSNSAKKAGREVWFDVHIVDRRPRAVAVGAGAARATSTHSASWPTGRSTASWCSSSTRTTTTSGGRWPTPASIGRLIRDGRVPVGLAANGLQVDGQNDNGWDQGLLFLNPSKVWLQPPGYVTRMVARHYLPRTADASVDGRRGPGGDGHPERGRQAGRAAGGQRRRQAGGGDFRIDGFEPARPKAEVEELAGQLARQEHRRRADADRPATDRVAHGLRGRAGGIHVPAAVVHCHPIPVRSDHEWR